MLIEFKTHFDYEQLNYDRYRQAYHAGTLTNKIAHGYGRSHKEVSELSADPDHGGKMTLSSLLETMVAFELEYEGILGFKVIRGPNQTDLEDGWGRKWDVKTPPYVQGIGFNETSAIHSILKKLQEFPKGNVGILLDISFLHKDNYIALQNDLKSELTTSQKFLIRQVVVKGVLD